MTGLINIIKKNSCLRCNDTVATSYCKKCYQELATKNMQQQKDYMRLEREQAIRELQIQKIIEIKDHYIKDLEYIRDCYYKEIAEREKSKKIFRLDKPDKPVSESEKMEVIIEEIKNKHIPRID